MPKKPRVSPEERHALVEEIQRLTDAFCDRRLNADYKRLCRAMAEELERHDSVLAWGGAAAWACGVIYAVGWVNDLCGSAQPLRIPAGTIARAFRLSRQMMYLRFQAIQQATGLRFMDRRWITRTRAIRNPLLWTIRVNGVTVDAREAPRETQEEALQKGMIPFIPASGEYVHAANDLPPLQTRRPRRGGPRAFVPDAPARSAR